MAARADLAGVTVDGWSVVIKAPAQNRVPFWTCRHDACDHAADLPHVSLVKAIAGKGGLPVCTTCVPADERPNIDHGLHIACGTAHLIGTPCFDGVQREPGPNNGPSNRIPGTITGELPRGTVIEPVEVETVVDGDTVTTISRFDWSAFEVVDDAVPGVTLYFGHPSENVTRPENVEPVAQPASVPVVVEEPVQLADASTGAVVIHGRVDRLEAPQDALDVIRRAMAGQQRNHQSEPGPSQFGGCERRLGYHLATGDGNGSSDDGAWRPQVGTAVHAWLDEVFHEDNKTSDRWLSSYRVTNPVAGTIDIADTQRGVAIDFKITGKTTRDKAARGDVSDKYEVQLDLYALGLINDGYAIERVALLLLPASGSLSESVWYERPVNLDRAREAVARRDRIKAMLSVAPAERVLEVLSTSDDYCASCPALGKYCKGFEGANLWGAPDSSWPAYDAAVKAAS